MAKNSSGGTMEFVRTIIYAILIALVARTIAFEPFSIPSGSMKPTLLIGDYLFVKKWTYGYSRHSFPLSQPPFKGRFLSQPVERGDVVVFKVPENKGRDFGVDYIKRIVGLPGDRIKVEDGILHINDVPAKREPMESWYDADTGATLMQYTETLPNGVQHRIIEESDQERLDNFPEIEVPAGHYFGMGDNRDNSSDSRVFGMIPEDNIVGRASFIFYSTACNCSLIKLWSSIPQTRIDRIATGIH
ncbi:MAG: signal peptidase I [Dongiaceae bacterium]